MIIYIDEKKRCHTTNPNGDFREFDVKFFDNKCQTFIEGFIFCPEGESYVRDDGEEFFGECKVPWKNYDQLAAAQAQYEADLADAAAAYQEGVNSAYDT